MAVSLAVRTSAFVRRTVPNRVGGVSSSIPSDPQVSV